MTRARERLIVSGSVDSAKAASRRRSLGARAARGRRGARRRRRHAHRARPRRRAAARARRPVPRAELAAAAAESRALTRRGSSAVRRARGRRHRVPPAPLLPELLALAAPPLIRLRRLSFTALSTFEQCRYKYWARYVVGHAERGGAARGEAACGVEVGDAVHRLLEQIDLAAPACRISTRCASGIRP